MTNKYITKSFLIFLIVILLLLGTGFVSSVGMSGGIGVKVVVGEPDDDSGDNNPISNNTSLKDDGDADKNNRNKNRDNDDKYDEVVVLATDDKTITENSRTQLISLTANSVGVEERDGYGIFVLVMFVILLIEILVLIVLLGKVNKNPVKEDESFY